MAILSKPHWETVTPAMRELLREIGRQAFASRFYLAGGTALALQLGHRRSIDLDFFSESDEILPDVHREILRALASLDPQIVEQAVGNFVLTINSVLIGFFGYGYPLVEESPSLEEVRLASLADIGLMKLDSLVSRGSRKDFYDTYFIARQVPLKKLFELSAIKYPYARDFPALVLRNMVLFDNADRDVQPDLLLQVKWETIKEFFVEQEKRLRQEWFGF